MGSIAPYEMHNYAASADSINVAQMEKTARNEKYSLRQRHKRKWSNNSMTSNNNNINSRNNNTSNSKQSNSTTLRMLSSGSKEVTSSNATTTSSSSSSSRLNGGSKAKSKAAPLSKYRRKTANARERSRMREINTAFETLRQCVPQSITSEDATSTNEKLTKITTLRMAMKYIRLLNEALRNPDFDLDFLWACKMDSSNMTMSGCCYGSVSGSTSGSEAPQAIAEMNYETERVEKSLAPRVARISRATERRSLKSSTKSNKSNHKLRTSVKSPARGPKCQPQTSTPKLKATTIATPLFSCTMDVCELDTLLLESDGESLHFSEHCLSPLQYNNNSNSNSSNSISSISSKGKHSGNQLLSVMHGLANEAVLSIGSISTPSSPTTMPMQSLSLPTIAVVATSTNTSSGTSAPNPTRLPAGNPFELSSSAFESTDSIDSLDFTVSSGEQPPSAYLSPLINAYDIYNPFNDILNCDFNDHPALDLFST